MKRSRFTESQIVSILKEADAGAKIRELCRKHGISDATYYNWKAKYGGMSTSDLRRLKDNGGRAIAIQENVRRTRPRELRAEGSH